MAVPQISEFTCHPYQYQKKTSQVTETPLQRVSSKVAEHILLNQPSGTFIRRIGKGGVEKISVRTIFSHPQVVNCSIKAISANQSTSEAIKNFIKLHGEKVGDEISFSKPQTEVHFTKEELDQIAGTLKNVKQIIHEGNKYILIHNDHTEDSATVKQLLDWYSKKLEIDAEKARKKSLYVTLPASKEGSPTQKSALYVTLPSTDTTKTSVEKPVFAAISSASVSSKGEKAENSFEQNQVDMSLDDEPSNRAHLSYAGELSTLFMGQVDNILNVWNNSGYEQLSRYQVLSQGPIYNEGQQFYSYFFERRTGLAIRLLSIFSDSRISSLIPPHMWYDLANEYIKMECLPGKFPLKEIKLLRDNAPPYTPKSKDEAYARFQKYVALLPAKNSSLIW